MRRDRAIRQLDLRGRFGAFFSGEGHAHCFDFPFSRRSLPHRLWFEGELSDERSRHFRGLSPQGDRLALSPAFSTREMRAGLDLRRDRRPIFKSPAAARAAGARLLAGRRLECRFKAVSRHQKLCGFRSFHPQQDFFRGHPDQSPLLRFALSGRIAPSSRSR
jgi:hypothetical protein